MHKHMYLEVGLKLLGVYVAVLGIGALAGALAGFMMPFQGNLNASQVGWMLLSKVARLATPVAYLALAYYLTRNTASCLRWCMEDQ